MGGCFSLSSGGGGGDQKPCAYVVSVNGELRQFPLPISVSEVVQEYSDSVFLCNSDALYFDDFIPSLESEHQLEPSQVYFVLPNAKLQYRLAASDMAALALKASVALHQINRRGRNNKTRISPVLVAEEDPQSNHTINYRKPKFDDPKINKTPNLVSRSGSVRKLTRYSSQRAKLAVRSFKMKLTTIYEGSVLHPSL